MLLFRLADEKAVDEGGGQARVVVAIKFEFGGDFEGLDVLRQRPGGGGGGVGDERVCAHGQAADGDGGRHVLADEVVEEYAGEAAAFGVERGGAAVDVIVRSLAAGEGEVTEPEGVGGDEVEQGSTDGGGHFG